MIPTPSHLLDRISPIFSPFFLVFLCVFTASPRRSQRAANRNPGPRNSRHGAQTAANTVSAVGLTPGVRNAWKAADVSGDGWIGVRQTPDSRDETRGHTQSVSAKTPDRLFANSDGSSGCSAIIWCTLTTCTCSPAWLPASPKWLRNKKLCLLRRWDTFDAIDRNHDHRVSLSEFRVGCQYLGNHRH